MVYINSRFT